ncbi:MAG: hypothetical protein IKJ43_02465 [Bacilli bacterium]|nr:hypothetical protein [Bacilli bacterium]
MKFEEYFELKRLSNITYERNLNEFMYPFDYCGKELGCANDLMVDSMLSYYDKSGNITNGIMIITPFQVISSLFAERAILHTQMFGCYNKVLYQDSSSLVNQNFYIRFYSYDNNIRISIEAPEIITSYQKKELEKFNLEIKNYLNKGFSINTGYHIYSANDYDIFGNRQINLNCNYFDDMIDLDDLISKYGEDKINDDLVFGYDYFKDDYLIGRPIMDSTIKTIEQVLAEYFKYVIQNGDFSSELLIEEFDRYKSYFKDRTITEDLLNYFDLYLDKMDLSIIKDYLEKKCNNGRKK